MKNFLFLMSCSTVIFSHSFSFAQYPTIWAKGGGEKNVNWNIVLKNQNPDEPGNYACNGPCSQSVEVLKASSTLAPQGNKNYSIRNLNDNDPRTAWVEGKPDYGIGEYFEVRSVDVNCIYNGYQSSVESWKNNSRVKKFKVYKNSKPICFLMLVDEMGYQIFTLPGGKNYNYDQPPVFRFEIMDIYPGLKWSDVAISHVDLVLCCFSANTIILTDHQGVFAKDLEAGDPVYTLDLASQQLSETEITQTTEQTHHQLLKITTVSREITLTPWHPLYFKDHGFQSIATMIHVIGEKEYGSLEGKLEVLIWNEDLQKTEYQSIKKIEEINGTFQTYQIMGLREGTTFVADGFVTRVY